MIGQTGAGYLSYDPALAATSGAATPSAGAGGGLVSGNGTFYSMPTEIGLLSDVSEMVKLTGTMAGTLTVEVSNGDADQDRLGTSDWATYQSVNGGGFSAGVATLAAGTITGGTNPEPIELKRVGFGRIRLKLVVTSGTGTISSRRKMKGMG